MQTFEQTAAIYATAAVAHEANRAWCVQCGDFSQPSWDKAPDWQRDSAVDGVTFLINNPLLNPIDSHNNWAAYKEAEGWEYGAVKCPEAKTHPCMVPYVELPDDQKMKDSIFHAVVWGMFDRDYYLATI